VEGGKNIPLNAAVRAMADKLASDKASRPTYGFDDNVGTMVLVGGSSYTPGSRVVLSPGRDVVSVVRKDGVHARLMPNDYVRDGVAIHCDGTSTEQAVGIFSADACGYFGYSAIHLESNGSTDGGTFQLESGQDTVMLYAGSTALLQAL
jgi:hypothetical protein